MGRITYHKKIMFGKTLFLVFIHCQRGGPFKNWNEIIQNVGNVTDTKLPAKFKYVMKISAEEGNAICVPRWRKNVDAVSILLLGY